jgi:hypothetical protein
MQRDRGKHLLKKPQLFVKVGRDKFALVDKPEPNQQIYVWSEEKQCIIPYPEH